MNFMKEPIVACGMTIPNVLKDRVDKIPNHPFIIFLDLDGVDEAWTYSDFYKKVVAVAAGLSSRGIRQGDCVFIHLDNSLEFVLSWFACAEIGAISVLSNTAFSGELIRHCYDLSESKAVITHVDYIQKVVNAIEDSSFICVVQGDQCGNLSNAFGDSVLSFDKLFNGSEPFLECKVNPTDPLTVVFTSGTTSRPKGVVWTHANAIYAGQTTSQKLHVNDSDVTYCHMPLFHVMALSYQLLTTFWVGGTVILQSRFDADVFWHLPYRFRCSWTIMTTLQRIQLSPRDIPKKNYRFWYTCLVAPIWEEKFLIKTIGGFGMSETSRPVFFTNRYADEPDGAIGNISVAPEIKIVDEHGDPVKPGEIGELLIHGIPGVSIFLEYLNDPDATKDCFNEQGWFKTNDLIKVDEEGFLYFVERKVDVLKVAGENVSSRAIEDLVCELNFVREVAVVGQPDDVLGEVPVVFYIPEGDVPENAMLLILELCRDRLATFMVPHKIIMLDEFPRLQVQKVAKNELKEWLSRGGGAGSSPPSESCVHTSISEKAIQENLICIWSELLNIPVGGIVLHSNFFKLGGNSLLAMQVAVRVGKWFGINIPIKMFFEYATIQDLAFNLEKMYKKESIIFSSLDPLSDNEQEILL